MKKEFKKTYLISILFIGFFSLSVIFLVVPLIKEIEKDTRDLIAIRGDREFFYEEKKNVEKFENIFKEIKPNFNKMNDLFVSSEVPIDFLDFLEKLALESNISIKIYTSVSLDKSDKNLWLFLNFNLEASGSFSDFSRFIEKLENSHYLIQIQNLTIRKTKTSVSLAEGSLEEEKISSSFVLKVFAE